MNDFNNQNNIPSVPPTPRQAPYDTTRQTTAAPDGQPAPQPTPPVQNPQPYPPIPQPVPQPIPQPINEPAPQPVPTQNPNQPSQNPPQAQYPYGNNQQYNPQYNTQQYNGQPYNQPYNQPPQSAYYNPNYAYMPKAVKEPMSGGVKAFVVIVIAILAASLIAFIAYIAANPEGSSINNPKTSPTFAAPTEQIPFTEPETSEQPQKEYKQSDAQNETKPKFGGIKLNKKPKKGKSGTQFAFDTIEKSVVGVIGYTDDQQGNADSYSVMGSGIIITSDGYVITNAHIVHNSRTAFLYRIITSGKKTYDAGVVGYDSRYDIAVLKIKNAKNLPAAKFGDSNDLKVAEDVIAVGNPRSINYQNSVTKGIVSALNRQASITNNARFIQTDTPINPGNSGGPLCNMYGQVVGITTSKIALEEYEGMGFAIPSNTVKSIADSIIRYGYVKGRVKIGIIGEVTTKEQSGSYGILISEISKGGPMDNTGAQKGDIIKKVDGKEIFTFAEIYDILEKHKPNDKIKVTIYRPDAEKTYDITVKLQEDKI